MQEQERQEEWKHCGQKEGQEEEETEEEEKLEEEEEEEETEEEEKRSLDLSHVASCSQEVMLNHITWKIQGHKV